ncbi:MAG: hypothetical protein ACOYMN_12090 [Roseimicrobium sp.]
MSAVKKTVKLTKAAPGVKAEVAKQHFIEGLITRGEVTQSGEVLSPGVTHTVSGPLAGKTVVKRRRFKLL